MADEIRKLGANDLELAAGGSGLLEYTVSPLGKTVYKLDATHIKLRNISGTLEDYITTGSVASTRITGEITESQLSDGAISQAKLATSIRAIDIVDSLPALPDNNYPINSAIVYLTSDYKLYRNSEDTWVTAVATTDLTGQITGTQIEDDSISTPKIQANAVTADEILAGEVQAKMLTTDQVIAGCISAGAVSADEIAANSIYSKHMLIGGWGAAINVSPNCDETTAWADFYNESSDASIAIQTITDGKFGNKCIRSTANSPALFVEKRFYPVDPSKIYRVKVWARKDATADGTFYLGLDLYDENDTRISGDGTIWYYPANSVSLTTDWTLYSGKFGTGTSKGAVPSNARKMRLAVLANYNGTAGYHEIQDIRIEEVVPGDLIVDGTITASHIAAGTITVDRLSFSNLSGLNASEGSKLSGIQDGATAGATWGSDITNEPTTLSDINSGEGTKLSGIEAGATVGAAWGSNITNLPTELADINLTESQKLAGIAEGADVTLTALDGGLIVTGTGLTLASGAKIEAGYVAPSDSNSYAGQGWKISSSGAEFYGLSNTFGGSVISSDGNYMVVTGKYLTATGLAKRYPINNATNFTEDGRTHFYKWVTSTWVDIASIGATNYGSGNAHFYAKSTVAYDIPVWVENSATVGIALVGYGSGTNGRGIVGQGTYGAKFYSGGYGVGANIILNPISGITSSTAPYWSAEKGSLLMGFDGTLYVNTDGSTTWQKVGSQ